MPHQPIRRWWQHPALIITALVLFPPAGIALAWTSTWDQKKKIVATVLSGLWFLVILLSDPPQEKAGDAKAPAAVTASQPPSASASPTPSATPSPTPTRTPDPAMPAVVGKSFAEAEKAVEDLVDTELTAVSAYDDVKLPADHASWLVCFQGPEGGVTLVAKSAATTVHLVAPGTACPAEKGSILHPKPAPAPTPKPTVDEDASGGGGGGSVSYSNCSAVRAAGKAPIHRGDPGYGRHLDRDGDGIACER
ncbi:excalibur calcium-binding domain-containing protein [Streptomyces sp. NPDC058746]|uniref:excalibur calcium-binding domain-containing protein n=1 Tax=Streptomyces sp. NPDC058746 TaxID=3346622 RepID=UPI00367D67E6